VKGAAAGLIFLGAWVFKTYKHYNELTTANLTLIPALIVILVGVVLFFLGCMGCCAAFKESKCLLAVVDSIVILTYLPKFQTFSKITELKSLSYYPFCQPNNVLCYFIAKVFCYKCVNLIILFPYYWY